jgi:deazaflavin-dependent oxidoreductase (nitroreductase family)
VRDSTAKRLSALHRVLFRITRGVIGRRFVHNDMLLLTTTGRNSGRPHTVPLLYLTEGDTVAVIASWGGRPHHPEWYLNLAADPQVEVQIDGERAPMKARTASPRERAVWWPRAVAAYAGYRDYQSRTEREIPVVLLEPRPRTRR